MLVNPSEHHTARLFWGKTKRRCGRRAFILKPLPKLLSSTWLEREPGLLKVSSGNLRLDWADRSIFSPETEQAPPESRGIEYSNHRYGPQKPEVLGTREIRIP